MKRRELLKKITLLTAAPALLDPFRAIANEVVRDHLSDGNGPLSNYIQFNLYGAPSRLAYDNPLSPYGDEYIRSPYVATNFKSNDKFADDFLEYRHVKLHGVQFPYMWGFSPLDQVGVKDFSELAKSFANIRGVWIGRDGHIPASSKILRDNNLGLLGKLMGHHKKCFVDGVITGNTPTTNLNGLEHDLEFYQLESAFDFQEAFYMTLIEGKNVQIEEGLNGIISDSIASLQSETGKEVGRKRTDLLKDLKKIKSQYIEEFPRILFKYRSIFSKSKDMLMSRSILPKIFTTNVTGIPIDPIWGGQALNRFMGRFHYFTEHSDIVKGFETASMDLWIQQFAIAEFLLVNKLCRCAVLGPTNKGNLFENYSYQNVISKINFEKKSSLKKKVFFTKGELESFQGPLRMDTHNTGSVLNMLSTSYFFYVFHSCLNNLVRTLKEKGLYNETLIHVVSEFERIPKSGESGSIHNSAGQSHSFYSGKIDGPFFIGDVAKGKREGANYGSANTGVHHRDLKRFITYNDIHETLSSLLIGKSNSNGLSLMKYRKGKIVPTISRSKVV